MVTAKAADVTDFTTTDWCVRISTSHPSPFQRGMSSEKVHALHRTFTITGVANTRQQTQPHWLGMLAGLATLAFL